MCQDFQTEAWKDLDTDSFGCEKKTIFKNN